MKDISKRIATIFLIIGILASSFLIIPLMASSQTTGDISPLNYKNNQWDNPTYAYSSNNQRASESSSGERVEYYNYNFGIPDDASNFKVYVRPEGYVSLSTHVVYVLVSWNNGTNWSVDTNTGFTVSESQHTINFTSVTNWTKEKLNTTNFIVRVWYWHSATCYPNNTYVISFDEKANLWVFKNMPKVKVGDMILVRGLNGSIYLSPVTDIQKHEGNFILRDIYSGELDVSLSVTESWTWLSHIVLTNDHPVHWYYDEKGEKEGFGNASDLNVGYYFRHLFHDPPYFRDTEIPTEELYTKNFPITKIIDTKNQTTVYNVDVKDRFSRIFLKYIPPSEMEQLYSIADVKGLDYRYLFDPPPISVTTKDTGYVDWIPVKVDYTIPEAWNFIETWQGQLFTRIWEFIEVWDGILGTREWLFIENWNGTLFTRFWEFVEFWNGTLNTRLWTFIEDWTGQLFTRAWEFVEFWTGLLTSTVAVGWNFIEIWNGVLFSTDANMTLFIIVLALILIAFGIVLYVALSRQ